MDGLESYTKDFKLHSEHSRKRELREQVYDGGQTLL